jgi:plasmid stabilization system protein ParE
VTERPADPLPIRWTEQAVTDLEGIHDYIARTSSRYATTVAARLVRAVEEVRPFPESGRVVPELGDPAVREVIHGAYRVIYELRGGVIEVLTVFRASRQFPLAR